MSDPKQCPRCDVWNPMHAPGDALCVGYQYADVIAAQVRRREAAETRLAAAERERDEARAMNAAFEVRIENWRELLASSRAEAARMELEMFRARDVAAEHVAAESKERRRAEEAEAEAERLRRWLREIEERTRPGGDMADQAVNAAARAALGKEG